MVALFVIAICIIAIFCMTVMSVKTNKALDGRNHISSLLRSYLVKMETAGCLSSSDVNNLVEDLELYGMTDIQLYGHFAYGTIHEAIKENYGPADYGTEVILRITGIQTIESMEEDLNSFLGYSLGFRELKVDISQKGISVR